jgi:uncharacterized membrane protein (DUF373 family)
MAERRTPIDLMGIVVIGIEGFVAVLLVLLAAWGAVGLVAAILDLVRVGVRFDLDRYVAVLDIALVIFIIVELFRIAVAYLRHEDVIPTVLEAGLVAIARKLVTFDSHAAGATVLMKAAGLGILMLSVGVTWYMLAKRNPRLLDSE